MKTKKWLKSGAKLLLTAAVTTLLLMLLNIGMDGMYRDPTGGEGDDQRQPLSRADQGSQR